MGCGERNTSPLTKAPEKELSLGDTQVSVRSGAKEVELENIEGIFLMKYVSSGDDRRELWESLLTVCGLHSKKIFFAIYIKVVKSGSLSRKL